MRVRIRELQPGETFMTTLTRRLGILLYHNSVLDGEAGSFVRFEDGKRKTLHPDVIVAEVDARCLERSARG